MFSQRKTVESMNCFAAPMWRFLCAKQFEKYQVLVAEKWRTNDERRTTKDERQKTNDERTNWLVRIFVWLVRIPNDLSESERLVRVRTIGPNSERMTSLTLLLVERADVVKFVKVSNAQKKFGVDWPRPSQFRKNFFKESMFKSKIRRGLV